MLYRLGGRESQSRYAGSFAFKAEAVSRKRWVDGELAALRVPDFGSLLEPVAAPTLAEAAERWRGSRVDVAEATRVLHRVALGRVLPILGTRRIDEITTADVADLVAELHAAGYRRETISKSVMYLAQTLDHAGVQPNPAHDKVHVKLPREEREEHDPPTAEHVEAVYRTLPKVHRLALLWLDWSGARVGSVDALRVSDYDEPKRRVRLRAATTKTRRALWVNQSPYCIGRACRGPRSARSSASAPPGSRRTCTRTCCSTTERSTTRS